MTDNSITSPVGEVVNMKLNGKNKKGVYQITLRFKDGELGVDEFKAKIVAINGSKIIDSSVRTEDGRQIVQDGHFHIKCYSKQEPKVYMGEKGTGNTTLLPPEEIPGFYAGEDPDKQNDTAKAIVVLNPSKEGQGFKPTVYLNSVILIDLNLAPRTEPEYKSLINEQLKALAS